MKLTKAEIDKAERVIFAIMEQCGYDRITFDVLSIGTEINGYDKTTILKRDTSETLNDLHRQAMNKQATESPF